MTSRFQSPFKVWQYFGAGLFILYFIIFLKTDNLARYGEAISFSGWLRTVEGKPYLSQVTELPLALNCYSPIFLLPLTFFAKVFALPTLAWYSVVAKIYCFLLLLSLLLVIQRISAQVTQRVVPFTLLFLSSSFLLFHSPDLLLTLRPDLLSYLFDLSGILLFLHYLEKKQDSLFFSAAILSGMAMSVKLNSIGGTLGIGIYLFTQRKIWRSIVYCAVATGIFGLTVFIYYLLWRQATFENLFTSIQSSVLPVGDLLRVYRQVLELLFFPLLPFFFLAFLGLNALNEEKGKAEAAAQLLTVVLGTQFVVASLGQMKWGAYFNYYFGMLFLAIVPVSCGLLWVERQSSTVLRRSVTTICFLSLAMFLARDIHTPLQIHGEKQGFAPVASFIRQQIPEGAIYTTSHNISVHLHDRVMLGAVSEELLSTTPKLKRYQGILFEKMAKKNFEAAVIDSPGCAKWHPPEYYRASLGSLTRLVYDANGVCVFARAH